jgi:hypothetical protein
MPIENKIRTNFKLRMRATQRIFGVPMSRLPDQIDAPITPRQLATLRALSAEAYQPKLLEPNLTAKEADRRIAILKAEIDLANSF